MPYRKSVSNSRFYSILKLFMCSLYLMSRSPSSKTLNCGNSAIRLLCRAAHSSRVI